MTQNELKQKISEAFSNNRTTSSSIRDLVDVFCKENVVIPKGENRHPYADILHLQIEGVEIEARYLGNTTFTWKGNVTLPPLDYEYRIKSIEPVYEWQWYGQKEKDCAYYVPNGWYTFEELQPKMYSLSILEETKRLRK